MKDMMGLMKKAKEMQEKMQEVQNNIKNIAVEGSAGGGMVRVSYDGEGHMTSVFVDPSMIVPGESEILEDLILAASNDAKRKLDEKRADMMREMTGGLELPPGMSLPF